MARQPHRRSVLPDDGTPAKQAILKASLQLFVRHGIAATSVRDIAEASGYTNPALFRHFESKEALAGYLFERIFCALRDMLPVVDDTDFKKQLRATLDSYLKFLDADPEATLYLQENLRRFWPGLAPVLRRRSLLAHMRTLIGKGVEQGIIGERENVALLTTAVLGLLGQFARQMYFEEFKGRAQDWLEPLYDLAMRLFTARGPHK
jgi:AcrR family transcriptional regulator